MNIFIYQDIWFPVFANTSHINYFMNNVSDKQTKQFQENLKTELRFSGYHVSFSPIHRSYNDEKPC